MNPIAWHIVKYKYKVIANRDPKLDATRDTRQYRYIQKTSKEYTIHTEKSESSNNIQNTYTVMTNVGVRGTIQAGWMTQQTRKTRCALAHISKFRAKGYEVSLVRLALQHHLPQ